MTIVGVVGDVKQDALDAPVEPAIYMAYRQRREELPVFGRRLSLAVRTRSDPAALVQSVRREIAGLDAELPLYQVRTMDEALRASVAPRRFQAALVGLFAALALLLAAIGVYGVVSCSVQQRTREIGIRIALGAEASDVLRMVLRQGMALVLGGLAAGAAAAAAVTRVLRSLLFEVSATDPVVFAAVSLLLAASALAACWLPAWRATRVDPLVVLRDQ
jgi:ABC-type antimicrobial peptide transport system permease subunit